MIELAKDHGLPTQKGLGLVPCCVDNGSRDAYLRRPSGRSSDYPGRVPSHCLNLLTDASKGLVLGSVIEDLGLDV